MWGIMVAQVYFTHFHKNAPSYTHRKNFRFPFWEIPVIFPKFGKKLGKNWENISQIWETFGTLYSLLVPIEGFFWEKNTIIFSQLNLGKIMGFFPIPFFFSFCILWLCYLAICCTTLTTMKMSKFLNPLSRDPLSINPLAQTLYYIISSVKQPKENKADNSEVWIGVFLFVCFFFFLFAFYDCAILLFVVQP